MARSVIMMTDGVEVKKVPIGYSWTVLFFSGFPCLFRQDWVWGAVLILCNLFSYGIVGIVCSFFYNKVYAKTLVDRGFYIHHLPPTESNESILAYLGYLKFPHSKV